MTRPRLVSGWRRGWRWASVQLMALSAAIQFGADALPPALHDALPAVWWRYLGGVMLLCAIAARFIRQNLPAEAEVDTAASAEGADKCQ